VFKKEGLCVPPVENRAKQWGTELSPHERVMLENIFAGGSETQLSSLKEPLLHCHSSDPARHHGGA